MFEFERTLSLSGALLQASRGKLTAMATRSTGLTGAATARAPSEARQPQSECGSAAEDDSFDVWLRRDLHRSYDATLAEPIPAQLLRLIEESDIP